MRTSNDRKMTKQSGQDKKAVFTLFKRLEAMGDNYGRTPTELGNYFSPPCKEKQMEPKKKETDVVGRTSATAPSRVGPTDQENVYTEPGAPPINPVPKPQRTFRHPASPPVGIAQRQGRGQRKLPPLPSSSTKACSKPPSGVHRRARGERVRENNANRSSFEFEDLFSRSKSLEHHYEDILDSSNENPYEDVELESQCSQQSLPSSPGADSTKASRPGFFRQNSARSFKLLDLRRTNQPAHASHPHPS